MTFAMMFRNPATGYWKTKAKTTAASTVEQAEAIFRGRFPEFFDPAKHTVEIWRVHG